jgi:hypothetical protein
MHALPQRLRTALAVLGIGLWKIASPDRAGAFRYQAGYEWAAAREWSANTYVVSTSTGPNTVTCGSSTSPGHIFHDTWLINGNPGHGYYWGNWIEVGLSYCDAYKSNAHFVFARSEGGTYFENLVPGPTNVSTSYKLARTSATSQQYIAQILPSGASAITAGTQTPSVNEISNYGGNWSQVGLEVSNRPGSSTPTFTADLLRYRAGPTSALQNWVGRDGCIQTNDPTEGWWLRDDAWRSRRASDAQVSTC